MGVSAADYDLDGNLDIVKTNFAGDTPSLYHNLGGANFEDALSLRGWRAHAIFGLGLRILRYGQRWLGGYSDLQRPCLPEVEQLKTEAGYAQRKLLYQKLAQRPFRDVRCKLGPESRSRARRGARLLAISITTEISTLSLTP